MKILFIHPPLASNRPNYQGIPLGLLYIASFLKKQGHSLKVIDYFTETYKRELLLKRIEDFKPDLLGYSSMTANYPQAVKINRDIKNNKIKTVIGGAHSTAFPEKTLKDGFDIVVRGEGEKAIAEIAGSLSLPEIRGISYYQNDAICHNPDRELEMDLDLFSPSARDLFPMREYKNRLPSGHRTTILFTSRGCPFNCTFCCAGKSVFGKKVRFHSPQAVLKDMDEIIKTYNIRGFDIEDDNFLIDKDRAEEIVDGFISRGWDIRWTIQATANFIKTKRFLDKMRDTGCVEITLGFESGNPEVLKKIKKGISLKQSKEAARLIKKSGIQLGGNFMLGFPFDTSSTIRDTINLARAVRVDRPSFFIVTPLPGSELFDWAIEKGFLSSTFNWERFNRETPIFTNSLTEERLKFYRNKAYMEVFETNFLRELFNLKKIARVLREEKNLFIILFRIFPTTKKFLTYFYGNYIKRKA